MSGGSSHAARPTVRFLYGSGVTLDESLPVHNKCFEKRSSMMNALKKIFIGLGILILLDVLLTGINIAQKGCGGYKGQTVEQILGVPADRATAADVEKLSRAQVVQLYYAAQAPLYEEMNGEYRATNVGGGVLTPAGNIYLRFFFGPGKWEGKGFSSKDGYGYNLFSSTKDGKHTISRALKMKTYIGKSKYDDKDTFHVDYTPYNSIPTTFIRDEIRKINDTLYICTSVIGPIGGTLNPMPFILYGEASPWVGIDEK